MARIEDVSRVEGLARPQTLAYRGRGYSGMFEGWGKGALATRAAQKCRHDLQREHICDWPCLTADCQETYGQAAGGLGGRTSDNWAPPNLEQLGQAPKHKG